MPTRQALHARAKRAARGLKAKGKAPWACHACGSATRSKRSDGTRKCNTCYPPGRRGRPRTIQPLPNTP
jgi:ribosomal protein L37AE/L43A